MSVPLPLGAPLRVGEVLTRYEDVFARVRDATLLDHDADETWKVVDGVATNLDDARFVGVSLEVFVQVVGTSFARPRLEVTAV